MSETKKAHLLARIESASMDVLLCLARIKAGGDADDLQIMLESAQDAHTDALELILADTKEV